MPAEAPPSTLLEDLDDEQREAVLAPRGPVCVLAGAGTGQHTDRAAGCEDSLALFVVEVLEERGRRGLGWHGLHHGSWG